jgi:hypothetical protein
VSGYRIGQPSVILVYQGEQKRIPLKCVFLNNKKYEFSDGVEGCFRVIPVVDSNSGMNAIGAGLYLSPRVKKSLFAKLYLFDEQSQNFRLVYTDDPNIPLALYTGRLIGPYKVWEISYPQNLKVPDYFYKRELPDPEVTKVKDVY